MRAKRLIFKSSDHPRLTHYLFRYPAKFHPPVARALIDQFTSEGSTVLDPFCGSGTLLVEALARGRNSVGVDIDPVATFVAHAKVRPHSLDRVEQCAERLRANLETRRRSESEYESRKFVDLAVHRYAEVLAKERLAPPAIPNLLHWFRRYVVVDLCRIRKAIEMLRCGPAERELFLLAFCSIIRPSSNADPVPVSGLEVTRYMREIDAAGRVVDPYALYGKALDRAIDSVRELAGQRGSAKAAVMQGSATALETVMGHMVDAVITSPPYHNAVDYYRRHQLESYWLRLTTSHQERLALRGSYLGQAKVRRDDPLLKLDVFQGKVIRRWEARMRRVSAERATALHHYVNSMRLVFQSLAAHLAAGSPAVFVVGHSSWNSSEIPTTTMFNELAIPWFKLRETFWYPISNRYMSYSRRNGANIDREYVLVFERQK
jgi:DNA methylase